MEVVMGEVADEILSMVGMSSEQVEFRKKADAALRAAADVLDSGRDLDAEEMRGLLKALIFKVMVPGPGNLF